MRIVRYHAYGPPEVLRTEEADTPEPGPGMVRIKAEAIGVNFASTQERRGIFYGGNVQVPASPGGDVVGTVDALGEGVEGVAVGDRVAGVAFHSSYADYSLAPARYLVRVPGELDAAEATMLTSPGQVALKVLDTARAAEGETVLVHAAAGAIGHLAVQLAKARGAGTVIATANSAEKLRFAEELGADAGVDYGRPGWADRVRELTGGRGVDVVLDSVGATITHESVALLAPFGRLVFYGSATGGMELPAVSLADLTGMRWVTHFTMDVLAKAGHEALDEAARTVAELVLSGRVRPVVHSRLPLTEAAKAHRLMEERAQLGRVVLIP